MVQRDDMKTALSRAASRAGFHRCARVTALLSLLVCVWLGTTGVAWAHALLVHSNPAADVVLPSTPPNVTLQFTEDLNSTASQIIVWDRYRHVMNRGHATLVPGQSREMRVSLNPLHSGAYLVLWTSVSAQDGHILHGSYLFFVGKRGPGPSLAGVSVGSPSQGFPDGTGLATIIFHWLELLTAVCWLGAAACSLLVFAPFTELLDPETVAHECTRVRTFLWFILPTLIVSSCGVLLLQAYELAGSWSAVFTQSTFSETFSDQFGRLWIVRQAVAVVALCATAAMSAAQPVPSRVRSLAAASPVYSRSIGTLAVAVLGFIYLAIFAASGHAAAADVGDIAGSSIVSGAVGADLLHFVGDALWFGGQIYIVIVMIPVLRLRQDHGRYITTFLGMLSRFSPLAYGSIALFTASGIFAAKIHIPSWYAFFHSIYGWTLLVKVALIGLMMMVSAFTVYVARPRIRAHFAVGSADDTERTAWIGHLLRWLRVNPVLGAGVLLATSVMFSYPVPLGLSPAGPSAYSFHIGAMTGTMVIKPDRSGPNELAVTLRDAHGQLVKQATVVVLTTMLDMEMGTGKVALTETGPGEFTGTGDLGMGGHWGLRILVYTPAGLTQDSFRVVVGT